MELKTLPNEDLRWLANYVGVEGSPDAMAHAEYLFAIMEAQARYEGRIFHVGRFKVLPDGQAVIDSESGEKPAMIGHFLVKRHRLASGDLVAGLVRKPQAPDSPPELIRVESVNGLDPDPAKRR